MTEQKRFRVATVRTDCAKQHHLFDDEKRKVITIDGAGIVSDINPLADILNEFEERLRVADEIEERLKRLEGLLCNAKVIQAAFAGILDLKDVEVLPSDPKNQNE